MLQRLQDGERKPVSSREEVLLLVPKMGLEKPIYFAREKVVQAFVAREI